MDGRPIATEASFRDIRSTADFIEGQLLAALELGDDHPRREELSAAASQTAVDLRGLATWLEDDLRLSLHDAFGEELYARDLALTYGDQTTPELLERIAMAEIETVRKLMEELAREAWATEETDFDDLMRSILDEMEAHRAADRERFLQEFLDLIDRSRRFLESQDLVDLPAHETLFTALSPSHFAGAAVGGVYSAGNDFTEGWASFCEQMTLDAGFEGGPPLTRMALLRKRLENAVRTYVSVQVHCRGWSRNQLHIFAVETGLLPPQFAENLWHRAVLTPIQLPSYFLGFRVFDEAFRREEEHARRGKPQAGSCPFRAVRVPPVR